MYKNKRIISWALTVLLLLSAASTAQAAPKASDTKNTAVSSSVKNSKKTAITKAELSVLLDEIFLYQEKAAKAFSDTKKGDSFLDAALKVDEAGIITRDSKGKFNGNRSVTRQEAAYYLYNAFCLRESSSKTEKPFADQASINKKYRAAANAMVQKGYMTAYKGNKFSPKALITKAEAKKILSAMTGQINSKPGTYKKNANGNLTLNVPGIDLKSMTIAGNLYITQGVGEGNISLDGVTVKGDIIALGGGANSIKLHNTLVSGRLITAKRNGKLRVITSGNTSIERTQIQAGTILKNSSESSSAFGPVTIDAIPETHTVTMEGSFGNVTVNAPDSDINVTAGSIELITIAKTAEGTSLTLGDTVKLLKLLIQGAVSVGGKGTITTADIQVPGAIIAQEPTQVILSDNISALIAGKEKTSKEAGNSGDMSGGGPGGSSGGNDSGSDNSGGGNNGSTPVIKNHVVKIIEFEYVRYLVIQFAEGTLEHYTVTLDGQVVEFTPVAADKSIVKYEIKDRAEHTVQITKDSKSQEYKVK